MKIFDLEDHKDFTNMFRMVERELNPEMKLFSGRARKGYAFKESQGLQMASKV